MSSIVASTAASHKKIFTDLFYQSVPPEDLQESGEKCFQEIADGLWQMATVRQAGEPLVRVIPEIEVGGIRYAAVEIINDDMPFLVDSITMALNRQGYQVLLVVHPVYTIERDAAGRLQSIAPRQQQTQGGQESFMHLRIPVVATEQEIEAIKASIITTLADVRTAVEDWQPMKQKLREVLEGLRATKAAIAAEEVQESADFIEWILENNFTFLGYREMLVQQPDKQQGGNISIRQGSGLGILQDENRKLFDGVREIAALPEDIQAFLSLPKLIHFTKTTAISTVHRSVPMDVITIKTFDAAGNLSGEVRVAGLLTSAAYNRSPRFTPILRRKVAYIMEKAGFDPRGHDGKALQHILETYPRDELFQTSEEELLRIALGILHLQERQRVSLFVRKDAYERYMSCLIFIPRDQYNLALRQKIQNILEEAFNGKTRTANAMVEESALARLYLVLQTTPKAIPEYDITVIEQALREAARSWPEQLKYGLLEKLPDSSLALQIYARFGKSFPLAYQDRYHKQEAVDDTFILENLYQDELLKVRLYRLPESLPHLFQAKIFVLDNALPLSDILPILGNMGLQAISEATFHIKRSDAYSTAAWIHDFEIATENRYPLNLEDAENRFQEALFRVWSKACDDDALNQLILYAGLHWRQVVILRSYVKYLLQTKFPYSFQTVAETLALYPQIAAQLVACFEAAFDPAVADSKRAEKMQQTFAAVEAALQTVTSLADDRIINSLLQVIKATLRTNYYKVDGQGRHLPYVSFKIRSADVADLPLPRPDTEIFVYATTMEAIHLRGGKVARGGIRWSDRKEDYRQEVLGLLKAQMVKNAVIVPVGAKGGFIVKTKPVDDSREALMNEVKAAYQQMIRGMLDITDTLREGHLVPPQGVVRHDADDPYLVVAADKGTATFSDIANSISEEYDFWLGDAFASGGSAGYDHKKMGITAKGAWEAVKRHFRERGKNIQQQDFTVVGIGDMAGDVFGNGMLLSPHICLQAAFNHRHIFLDPNPNAAQSWQERKRLFEAVGSQWSDYNPALLSAGGMIVDRSVKSVNISSEIQEMLGVATQTMTPNALIQAILRMEVELLWFGGIGTFIRASAETDADASDKANDAVRITAKEVRAKVIGEGANLGMTHRARIEYALLGGAVNSDAIDNSGGVDCSDHEVNIKILLQQAAEEAGLQRQDRDVLLEEMTENVAQLVLRNNYLQTQALSLAQYQGGALLHQQAMTIRALEKAGKLNRALEFLPDDEMLEERFQQGQGLTRPELAVLLVYSKIDLFEQLLDSKVPDEQRMLDDLQLYFPDKVQQQYAKLIPQHRLRREIIVAHAANSIVNRVGSHFVTQVRQATGMPVCDIARAYAIARDSFVLRDLWNRIEALDNEISAQAQLEMLKIITSLVEYVTFWFLQQGQHPLNVTALVAQYRPALEELRQALPDILDVEEKKAVLEQAQALQDAHVPEALAMDVAYTRPLGAGCDIVRLALRYSCSVPLAGETYFLVGSALAFSWLRQATATVKIKSAWHQQAVEALKADFYDFQQIIAGKILAICQQQSCTPQEGLAAWQQGQQETVESLRRLIADLQRYQQVDVSMLLVTGRLLKGIA